MRYLIIFLGITYFIGGAYLFYSIKKDDNIIEKTKNSIVIIKNKNDIVSYAKNPLGKFETNKNTGIGAGFFIDKNGTILTTNHIIENKSNYYIAIYKDKNYNIEIISRDTENDIAKVKINDIKDFKYLNIEEKTYINEEITSFGTSEIGEIIYNTGVILKYGSGRIIEISNDIKPGFSGGPIINKNGDVIGINFAIEKDKNFGVKLKK